MAIEKFEPINTFRKQFDRVSGKSYVAASVDEIVHIISTIAVENRCTEIVNHSSTYADQIRVGLEAQGIRIRSLSEAEDSIEMLSQVDMAITGADLLVAQTGTIVARTVADEDRLATCLPRIQVTIIGCDSILDNLNSLIRHMQEWIEAEEPNTVTLISGPSRTSDIEVKQILGVHGPHQVHVIIFKP